MAVDKVKSLKIENPATGGTNTDPYPTEVNPSQDYLATKGIAFENLDTVLVDKTSGTGEIQFTDLVETSPKTVRQLRTASQNIFDNSTNGFVNTNVQSAIQEYAQGIRSATTNINLIGGTAPSVGQVLVATSTTAARWQNFFTQTYGQVGDSANATTTSGTDAVLTTMTSGNLTAGTYLFNFTSSITSNNAGASVSYSFYLGGTQQPNTLMKTAPFDGGTLSVASARGAAAITYIATLNGSQALEVRWSTTGGTATCGPRTMTWLRVQ